MPQGWECVAQGVHLHIIAIVVILHLTYTYPRIEKEGLTERAIILCKLNKSLLESSKSVGIHRQKSLYSLKNLCI